MPSTSGTKILRHLWLLNQRVFSNIRVAAVQQLSMGWMSKETIVQGTVLQGDYCPRRYVPWRTVSLDNHPLDNCCTTPGARKTEICWGKRKMNFFCNVNIVPGSQNATHFIESGKFCSFFATLGSILNSQLTSKSGKSQLARWSHRVALLLW